MITNRALRAARLAAALAAWVVGDARAVMDIRFAKPRAGEALFGAVDVEIEVTGATATKVTLYLGDGRKMSLDAPPWRFSVDFGAENLDRELSVVATSTAGERVEATLRVPRVQIDEEIDLPLRQIYVSVERRGREAPDLRRGDFEIVDDGERQEIVTFERGDVPLTAVLIVDSSTSMEGAPLDAALAGVRDFATRLAPLDEATLVLFSDHVEHLAPIRNSVEDLLAGPSSVSAGGGSAVNDHLYLALELLERRQGRRVAILLSDGVDIESLLSAEQVAGFAARSQAMIFWIRAAAEPFETLYRSTWREPESHAAELDALDDLVRSSGGRRIDIPDVERASGAFREIVDELRGQYVLGYYPTRCARDGSWHRVQPRSSVRGVRLRAREGYFDD